jgi:nucleotide-binding universal stress UspA family protein
LALAHRAREDEDVKVLVALDDSPTSLRAAREASRLFPTAEFLVINVNRRPVPWIAEGPFGMVQPVLMQDLPIIGLDDEHLAELAELAGIEDADTLTAIGDPASMICAAAEQHDVDAVVVGSHDRGVLRRLVDPSVAQAVVQGTYRPVVIVSGLPPTTDPGERPADEQ